MLKSSGYRYSCFIFLLLLIDYHLFIWNDIFFIILFTAIHFNWKNREMSMHAVTRISIDSFQKDVHIELSDFSK